MSSFQWWMFPAIAGGFFLVMLLRLFVLWLLTQ